jgi:hypothetical protein
VDFILDPTFTLSSALGGGAAIIGCVMLSPELSDLAETGSKIAKRATSVIQFIGKSADWGACALSAADFVNNLNGELLGTASGVQITDSITALTGCVGDALSYLLTHPGASLQGLGL